LRYDKVVLGLHIMFYIVIIVILLVSDTQAAFKDIDNETKDSIVTVKCNNGYTDIIKGDLIILKNLYKVMQKTQRKNYFFPISSCFVTEVYK
jgi:hypothetical protein